MNNATRLAASLVGSLSLAMLAACNESEAQAISPASAAGVQKAPREVCTEKVVTIQKPAKDKERVLGTVAGAVVGGVVGHEVGGKGTSQDIATVGGVVAGGYAGNRVQKSMQKGNTEQTTERTCRMVYD